MIIAEINNTKKAFEIIKEVQNNADKAVFSHHAEPCTELVDKLRKELESDK